MSEERPDIAASSVDTPQVVAQETPVKKYKFADPPHFISIGLSLLALIISCLSWWEANRNRVINEEINRPILAFAGIKESRRETTKGGALVNFNVALKNTGKFTAVTNSCEITCIDFNNKEGCGVLPVSRTVKDEIRSTSKGLEILPGLEEQFMGETILTPECEKQQSVEVLVDITVIYTDSTSGKQYWQSFMEHANLTPKDIK